METGAVKEKAVLALYNDTQGSTAVVMNPAGLLLGRSSAMISQHLPQPGWVEYDPYELWHRSWQAIQQACHAAGVSLHEMGAMAVVAQQGTALCWERATGRPIGPAISWRCQRTAEICRQLQADGCQEMIHRRTGGRLDTTTAGLKLQWLLSNIPGLRQRAEQGQVCCGTVDSWLLWNLTGGAVHATDRTQASDTLLMNLRTGEWDEEILHLMDIPPEVLPQVRPSGFFFGHLAGGETAVTALCADLQASLYGQACFAPGIVQVTYGRDAIAVLDIGSEPPDTAGELRAAAAAALEGEPARFVLTGRVLAAGLVVEWLRDELALIPTAADSEALAQQSQGDDDLYLVPALLGLGAPHWRPDVRGAILGLTPTAGRARLVRAALEGVAYCVRDVVEALARWSGQEMAEVRADGGAAANNFLLQFQADILGLAVRRSRLISAAATGAAYLAGLQSGLWASREEIAALWRHERQFVPTMPELVRRARYQGWQEAVQRLLASI